MTAFLTNEQMIRNTHTLNKGWNPDFALEVDGQGLIWHDHAVQVWVEGTAHLDLLEEDGQIDAAERFRLDLLLLDTVTKLEEKCEADAKARKAAKAAKDAAGGKNTTPTQTGGLRSNLNANAEQAAEEDATRDADDFDVIES